MATSLTILAKVLSKEEGFLFAVHDGNKMIAAKKIVLAARLLDPQYVVVVSFSGFMML